MARETCPAILMIPSSPAPDSASSVTKVWRLSCHRPFTPAFSRTLVHAVLKDVNRARRVFGERRPEGEHKPLRPALPEPPGIPGGVRLQRGDGRFVQRNHAPRP